MFRPARMLSGTIGVHAAYRDAVLQALHEGGILEIHAVSAGQEDGAALLKPGQKAPFTTVCATYRLRLDRILGALAETRPSEPSLFGQLTVREPALKIAVPVRPLPGILDDVEEIVRRGERALEIQKEVAQLRDTRASLERDVHAAGLLVPFGVRPEHLGSSAYLSISAGLVPAEESGALIRELETVGGDEWIARTLETPEGTTVVVATLREHAETVDGILRRHSFEPISLTGMKGSAREVVEQMTAERNAVEGRIRDLLGELRDLAAALEPLLLAYREEMEVLAEEGEAAALLAGTEETAVVQGFLRATDRDRLENLVEQAAEGHAFCRFAPPAAGENPAPVAYENPAWARPFEMFTTLFSRPRYHEIDPTVIIAPVIVLYFGFMLGDAAYGAILTLAALLLYRGAGTVSPTIRDLALVLAACGVSGTIFGILQGSYFGDALPRFFGIRPPFVLVDPLQQPVTILVVALAIGILQINFGLLLAVHENVQAHRYREAFFEQGVWFLLQPAAAVLMLDFFAWQPIPDAWILPAAAAAAASIAAIFLHRGPLGFFGLTGFLGDWLSYTRLLALDLATAGIILTINILAAMIAAIHPLLLVAAVIFWIVANLLNLVLQTLGGMIHALRLQYVEFFGKFYRGGGRRFAPFSADRIYTIRADRGERHE
ncbi:MAG: V-type ATP synthase subunit I [Methanomicrobiales archaeon]|nr:V-type ATP synthase subunit I [Methanomicrobiales archaeon]